jgi:4'-phosphopantetheinyl transferase
MNISDPAFRLEAPVTLAEDEVHVWRIDLPAVAPEEQRWKQMLSEDERERASRFHFLRDREYFTATRALLRTILAGYTDCDPKGLRFCYTDKGKPFLDTSFLEKSFLEKSLSVSSSTDKSVSDKSASSSDSGTQIEFNVSHSGRTALLAFAHRRALGVDVEHIRADFDCEAVARRFFSDHEVRQLDALPQREKHTAFFRCWTRKEAYIKAIGTGLSLPLCDFDVSLTPRDKKALLSTRPDGTEAQRWSLQDIPAGDDYVAALCVEGHGWQLKS